MKPGLEHTTVDGVATLTVRNPAKRNAMTTDMWRELRELLAQLGADRDVRALVLTGYGGTFCGGADINSLRAPDGYEPARLAVEAEAALLAFPRPTLAVVRGHCVGGGCQLAAACDLRFACDDALFGVTPARLGIPYPLSSTRRLVSLTGQATAKYLLYSAELIGADRALRTGLVDEVLPSGALDQRVAEFTTTLATRSQLSQAVAKEYVEGTVRGDLPGLERQEFWVREALDSGELAEGAGAFLEGRAPHFPWTP